MERYLKSPPNFLFVTAFTLTTPEKKKTRGGEKNNQETIEESQKNKGRTTAASAKAKRGATQKAKKHDTL